MMDVASVSRGKDEIDCALCGTTLFPYPEIAHYAITVDAAPDYVLMTICCPNCDKLFSIKHWRS